MALHNVQAKDLRKDQEIIVYGKLRKRFTNGNKAKFINAPGRKGKVSVKAVNGLGWPNKVFVKFPKIDGEWEAFDKNLFVRHLPAEAPVFFENNLLNTPNPVTPKVPEKPQYKLGKGGLEEMKEVHAWLRQNHGLYPDPVPYLRGYTASLDDSIYHTEGTTAPARGIVSYYGFVFSDGRWARCSSTHCHSGMNTGLGAGPSITHVVNYVITGNKPLNEAQKDFYTWLLNKSPWAECYITKTWEEAYASGIVIDANKPYNLVAGAAVAQRFATEFADYHLPVWHAFMKGGIDPCMSMFFSTFFREIEGKISNRPQFGHIPFDNTHATWSVVKNLKNNTPNFLANRSYAEYKRYGDINKTWGYTDGRGAEVEDALEEAFSKAVQNSTSEDKAVKNPFGAKVDTLYTKDVGLLIEEINKIIEEKVQ